MWKLENLFNDLFRMSYYAVAKGRQVGLFKTWSECESQVKGFRGAVFKKFPTEKEAKDFISKKSGGSVNFEVKKDYVCKNSDFTVGSDELSDEALLCLDIPELKVLPKAGNCSTSKRKLHTDATSLSAENPSKKLFNIKYTAPSSTTKKKYGKYEFEQDENGFVHVYTDGSCENNGRANAVAGLGVFFADHHPLNAAKPVIGRPTNNCGEIQASILAIQLAHDCGITRLLINTDSQFLIKSICKWLPGWKRRKWKLPNGEPVKNKVDFEKLDNLMRTTDMTIKWNYVKAHCGIHGNEMADQLAKEGGVLYKINNKLD